MRLTEAQFATLTRKRPIRRRLTASKFAPVAAQFNFPVWTLTLPLVVVSEANQREFWRKRHARNKAQQGRVAIEWLIAFGSSRPNAPCRVQFTKLGGQKLDSGNLEGAFKHVQDAVARILGIDDGSDLITWTYDQQPGGEKGIRVEIVEGSR